MHGTHYRLPLMWLILGFSIEIELIRLYIDIFIYTHSYTYILIHIHTDMPASVCLSVSLNDRLRRGTETGEGEYSSDSKPLERSMILT